jgi:hypothetical protein
MLFYGVDRLPQLLSYASKTNSPDSDNKFIGWARWRLFVFPLFFPMWYYSIIHIGLRTGTDLRPYRGTGNW